MEAYQDAQEELNEYACQTQIETCQYACENGQYEYQNQDYNYNNNNNGDGGDNYCYYTCMADAGMSYCEDDNGNDMNMDELMECRQLGGDNNNNNNNQYYGNSNYQVYYVGAYCTADGVYVSTFTDSQCSNFAPKGTYEKYYGYSLPTNKIVGTDCISCKAPEENNNNNNNNNYNYQEEVYEVCEELYQDAGKCEQNMDIQYPNNAACELMHVTLARLDSAMHNSRRPAVGLAWFFGISLALLSAYVVWLHVSLRRRHANAANQVNLLPSFPGSTVA